MKRKKKDKKGKLSRRVEVDVSGQIGDTKDTVFAFSNGENFSLLIRGKEKRRVLDVYRTSKNRPKDFPLHFYIAGLKILFSSSNKKLTSVILDREVKGHEQRVIIELSSYIKGVTFVVKEIGHKSNAHNLAYDVFIGKCKPNTIIRAQELLLEMGLKTKK